jgi:hypothetical protein
LGLFGFAIFDAEIGRHRHPSQQGQTGGKQTHPQNDIRPSLWERTTDDPVAFFTMVLAVGTLGLAITSTISIRYLIAADRTARRAAKSAERMAKTAFCRWYDPQRRRFAIIEDPDYERED